MVYSCSGQDPQRGRRTPLDGQRLCQVRRVPDARGRLRERLQVENRDFTRKMQPLRKACWDTLQTAAEGDRGYDDERPPARHRGGAGGVDAGLPGNGGLTST